MSDKNLLMVGLCSTKVTLGLMDLPIFWEMFLRASYVYLWTSRYTIEYFWSYKLYLHDVSKHFQSVHRINR